MISPKHYKAGDAFPSIPKNDPKLQLLSMRFCPFAHRIHLALDAKNIQFHVVYVNLTQKPEWITDYSPLGKVPALILRNEPNHPTIYESLLVVDYLDEKYPENPLHPSDPLARTMDRLWLEQFSSITFQFYRLAMNGEDAVPDALNILNENLDKFDKELGKRKTTYYNGNKPGILDYMIWPWFERFPVLEKLIGADKFELSAKKFPNLYNWSNLMSQDTAVKQHYLPVDIHLKYFMGARAGNINYDIHLDE